LAFWSERDFDKVADRLGVKRSFVERLMNDLWPDVRVFLGVDWGVGRTFSDTDLLAALREASLSSAMPSPMATEDYDRWAAADNSRPAAITIAGHLGGWRPALIAAGLPANTSRRKPGSLTAEVCVEAMADCWREVGSPPSMAVYSRWQENRPGAPGADMVRARLRSWTDAKLAAYPQVHGKHPPGLGNGPPTTPATATAVSPSVGRAYRARDIAEWRSSHDVFSMDPAVVERAVRSHFDLEALVASLATEHGYVPISPTGSDPQFDVAWRRFDGSLAVVEVKSATHANLESQVRLGLGQILGYAELLRDRGERVQPVLLVELTPHSIWVKVGHRIGLTIVGAEAIGDLFPPEAEN
jgi:hypothetical protein